MPPRCDPEWCGRRLDRPAGPYCKTPERHPEPDLAQRIVAAIEVSLEDRRGLNTEWEQIDDNDPDIIDEIRDEWADLVRGLLP